MSSFAGMGVSTVQAVGGTVAAHQAGQQNYEELAAYGRSVEQAKNYELKQRGRELAIEQGKARAITAATSTVTSSGTPLILELDNAKQSAMELLNIRRDYEMEEARNVRAMAQAKKNMMWNILSLGGNAGSVAGGWMEAAQKFRDSRRSVRTPRTSSGTFGSNYGKSGGDWGEPGDYGGWGYGGGGGYGSTGAGADWGEPGDFGGW